MKDVEIIITIRDGKVANVSVSTQPPHAGTRKKRPSGHAASATANADLTIEIDADLIIEIQNLDAASPSPLEERVDPPAETDAESAMEWHRYEELFPESFESDYDENSQYAQHAQTAVGARSPRK